MIEFGSESTEKEHSSIETHVINFRALDDCEMGARVNSTRDIIFKGKRISVVTKMGWRMSED